MKPTKKAWVQAAIDVTDLALAQKAARIAKEAGAEWIEVGTPLLFEYGHKSIDAIRSVVGELPLVADYKVPGNAVLVMEPARQHGAQFAIVMNAQDDYSAKEALELSRQTGVKVIFTMDVPGPQMAARAKQLEALGAEYIMVLLYF